ncbi:MAG: 23S rRNA (uracil(1939)-C(5))-methyltransferase RlmD [Myxococcota bacterium]
MSVDVLAVAKDGLGVGRGPAGEDVRLAGVLPEEQGIASVVHVRRDGLHFARLERVQRSSPHRRPSPCRHFLTCGGCDFLHAAYDWQLDWKRRRVAQALQRPPEQVAATVPSPRPTGYRGWVKLVRGPGALLGSYAPRSHRVVDMSGCVVHAEGAEAIAAAVRRFLRQQAVAFRYLLLRWSFAKSSAVVTVVVGTQDRSSVGPLVSFLAERDDVAQIRQHINDDPGDALLTENADEIVYDHGGPIYERIASIDQNLAGGAFAQVNPNAAAALYQRVADGIAAAGADVLDLYAGSGGIALTLLHAGAARVVAVESHPAAVEAARGSARASGWSARFTAIASTVEKAWTDDLLPRSFFERIVVNPPRKGLSAAVRARLAQTAWRRLVYVSCNPDTLARDLPELGGAVKSVVPVDLFPQTRHVETVVTLVR